MAKYLIAAAASACLGAAGVGQALAEEGWYTTAQATAGHQLFNNYCAECHRPDLTGAAGPALVGQDFLAKWGDRPLGDLYTFEHSQMPAVNPGSLPEDEIWAITAYILERNGFAAGNAKLDRTAGPRQLPRVP